MRCSTLAVALVIFSAFLCRSAKAEEWNPDIQSLTKISEVKVLVEPFDGEAKAYGINEEQVRVIVENALMRSGIRVLPLSAKLVPFVDVAANCLELGDENRRSGLTYSINFEVCVPCIRLVDVQEKESFSKADLRARSELRAIWSKGRLSYAGANRLPQSFYESVTHQAEILCHDLLLAQQNIVHAHQ